MSLTTGNPVLRRSKEFPEGQIALMLLVDAFISTVTASSDRDVHRDLYLYLY